MLTLLKDRPFRTHINNICRVTDLQLNVYLYMLREGRAHIRLYLNQGLDN